MILPGSKLVIKDLIWLKETPTCETGLGFIDDNIIFQEHKVLSKKLYNVFKNDCDGFEIHHGISKKYPLSFEKNNIKGTFVHGLYNDETFMVYKKKTINEFIDIMKKNLDIDTIYKSVLE